MAFKGSSSFIPPWDLQVCEKHSFFLSSHLPRSKHSCHFSFKRTLDINFGKKRDPWKINHQFKDKNPSVKVRKGRKYIKQDRDKIKHLVRICTPVFVFVTFILPLSLSVSLPPSSFLPLSPSPLSLSRHPLSLSSPSLPLFVRQMFSVERLSMFLF